MSTLYEQRTEAIEQAEAIATDAKNAGREFSDAEVEQISALNTTVEDLDGRIAKHERTAKTVKDLADVDSKAKSGPASAAETTELGQAFTGSDAYKNFQSEHPSGVGSGTPVAINRVKVGSLRSVTGAKVATTGDAHLAPVRFPMITPDNPQLTLLDVVTRGQTQGSFEYIQIQNVTRNAAVVPEASSADDDAALKPISEITTGLADAKVYTYADGLEVTNQMLSDAPALATYMDSELRFNVNNVLEEKLLNGSGTNGEPTGIMNTTGVQQQAFETDVPRTVRQAILKITQAGAQVTGIVLSPEDDAELDLMTDGNQRYYGQGPFGMGPNTLWGRPRIVSHRLPKGTAILGDLRTVTLLDREGLSVLAFNQHKDYAQRNMTYIRAELRAAQAIFKPSNLAVVSLSGAEGNA